MKLEQIVTDAEQREILQPYFERATASGDLDFEYDWQWQAYCDLLYAVADFKEIAEKTIQGFRSNLELACRLELANIDYSTTFKTIPEDELHQNECELEETVDYLINQAFPQTVRRLKEYSEKNSQYFQDIFFGWALTPKQRIFLFLDGPEPLFSDYIDLSMLHRIPKLPIENEYLEKVYSGDLIDIAALKIYISGILYVAPVLEESSLDWYRVNPLLKNMHEKTGGEYKEIKEEIKKISRRIRITRKIQENLSLCENEVADLLQIVGKYNGIPKGILSRLKLKNYRERRNGQSRLKEAIFCIELSEQIPGYQVIRKIAEGGGREVYNAWDEIDECSVVIKIEKEDASVESSNMQAQRERYVEGLASREGRIARTLTHPNLVRYFGRGQLKDGRHYVIEEAVTGLTFREAVKREVIIEPGNCLDKYKLIAKVDGKQFFLTLTRSLRDSKNYVRAFLEYSIREITQGLSYLHGKGLIHRDIKPGNLFTTFDSGDHPLGNVVSQLHSCIGDLELVGTPAGSKGSKIVHGSRRYTAPEVLEKRLQTKASDIFSLGVVMYEVYEGEHPFVAEETQQVAVNICDKTCYTGIQSQIQKSRDIPRKMKPIIRKCLQYDPEQRYQDATELLKDLERSKWTRPVAITGAAVALGAAVIFGGVSLQQYYQDRELQQARAAAQEMYDMANESHINAKITTSTYTSEDDFAFYYRVATILDPRHSQAHKELCVYEASMLDRARYNKLREINVAELWELRALEETEVFDPKKGEVDLSFVPETRETILLCEKARTLTLGSDAEILLALSRLYEIDDNIDKAIELQEAYLNQIGPNGDGDDIGNGNYRLIQLTGKKGLWMGALEISNERGMESTHKAEYSGIIAAVALRVALDPTQTRKTGRDALYKTINSAKKAIELAEDKKSLDLQVSSTMFPNPTLAEYYYIYGYARLKQHILGMPDVPNQYALFEEDRRRFSSRMTQQKYFMPRDDYYPRPLDDAESALIISAELDNSNIYTYTALAKVFELKGEPQKARQAQERARYLQNLKTEFEQEQEVYTTIYPIEEGIDKFRVTIVRGNEWHPLVSFSQYVKQHELCMDMRD